MIVVSQDRRHDLVNGVTSDLCSRIGEAQRIRRMVIHPVTKTHTPQLVRVAIGLHVPVSLIVLHRMTDRKNYFGQTHQLHLQQIRTTGD